jgi:glycyl-tRNA synthetase beta chain
VDVAARLLPQIIADMIFPKVMRWNGDGLRFARPVRWILALFGRQVIPFRLGGVDSGQMTRGHRTLASGSELAVT